MTDHDAATASVFRDIHNKQSADGSGVARVRGQLNCKDLRLPEGYFTDKHCADLGCGATAAGTLNLLDLGARFVQCLNLDPTLTASATRSLEVFSGRWAFGVGSVELLPFADDSFDFVLCQGVIHHVANDSMAMAETHRVLKPGGHANIMVHGAGGLMTRFTMEILRPEYQSNPLVRRLFDDIFAGRSSALEWLREESDADSRALIDILRPFLARDIAITIEDRLKAPKYNLYTEAGFKTMLMAAGFQDVYRVTRRPNFAPDNMRKLLAPLYEHYDSDLARIIYGEGMITVMATK